LGKRGASDLKGGIVSGGELGSRQPGRRRHGVGKTSRGFGGAISRADRAPPVSRSGQLRILPLFPFPTPGFLWLGCLERSDEIGGGAGTNPGGELLRAGGFSGIKAGAIPGGTPTKPNWGGGDRFFPRGGDPGGHGRFSAAQGFLLGGRGGARKGFFYKHFSPREFLYSSALGIRATRPPGVFPAPKHHPHGATVSRGGGQGGKIGGLFANKGKFLFLFCFLL